MCYLLSRYPGQPISSLQYSYDILHLSPGGEYEAQVQAMNKFGWSQRSDPVRFTAGQRQQEEEDTKYCE